MAWFSLKDSFVHVQKALAVPTPAGMSAIPAGAPIRLLSAAKITFDPGGKASYVKGSGITPVAIAIGTAEGKLEIECSNAFELAAARKAIGGIGSCCIVLVNFVRPLMTPLGYMFLPSVWENGGGFDGDDAKGFSDKLVIKYLDALEDGSSIYNRAA